MPAGPRAVLCPSLPLHVLPSAELRSRPSPLLDSWSSLEGEPERWLPLEPPSSVSPLRRSARSTNEKRAVMAGASGATARLRVDRPTVWCRRSCSQLLGCLQRYQGEGRRGSRMGRLGMALLCSVQIEQAEKST